MSLQRLEQYQLLVLPGVDCFSDVQREAVRRFQARGGRVISVKTPICCDADAVPRPAGETLAAKGEGLIEIEPALLERYAREGDPLRPETPAEALAAAKELQTLVSPRPGRRPIAGLRRARRGVGRRVVG